MVKYMSTIYSWLTCIPLIQVNYNGINAWKFKREKDMVDFGSLVDAKKTVANYDLDSLYSSLDVKSTHTEPRPAQREAMAELTKRHAEKDLVLKISTGAGKTTVGLL